MTAHEDSPCVDGCGQDAATIERLERSRAVAVRQLGEALDRAERAEAAIERARDALDSVGVLHPVAADRVLRALDGPQDAASAPEAPGQPGRGEEGSGGRTAGLVGILRQHEDQTDRSANDGCSCGYPDPHTFTEHLAEALLADPAPLLTALPDSAIEAECLRRFHPVRHMTGLSD